MMSETNISMASNVLHGGDHELAIRNFEMMFLDTKQNFADIKDLTKSIAQLKEKEPALMKQEVKCRHEVEELEEQLKHVNHKEQMLKEQARSIKLEELRLKREIESAERRKQPSARDLQILEKQKKKLKHYKNLTGLKWDFTAPEDHCVGYVFNSTTSKMQPFAFDNMSSVEQIWSEVKAVAKPDW